jgi:hypothetical protein
MKAKFLIIVFSIFWIGLQSQTVTIHIQESAGECLLNSDCEQKTLCYDLLIDIDQANWELRSYNIWFQYPSPPYMSYNSDNACLTQNGGDTDNNQFGQYRVAGINGNALLQQGVLNNVHTICFEYTDAGLIIDSSISVGGTALVYGFPFESTLTLLNRTTGATVGMALNSTETLPISMINNQPITAASGWSGVSSWLQPDEPDIEQIMEPVVNDLVVMYNLTDGIYFPSNNINTLVNWNHKSGYITKTSQEIIFGFCGSEGQNKEINLMAGWNVIPVLSNQAIPVSDVLGALGSNLVLAKEIAGYRVYYPAFSISTLNMLEPTKAYFVKVLSACTITFPDFDNGMKGELPEFFVNPVSPWNPIYKTPESHVFCFSNPLDYGFITGDIVGAFDQNGICSGVIEVIDENQPFVLSAFGNDETTPEKDGLIAGELVSLRLWRPSNGETYNLNVSFTDNSPSQGNFVVHGISIIKNAALGSLGTQVNNFLNGLELSVYPNPTKDILKVVMTGDVMINGSTVLTDSKGQVISKSGFIHNESISRLNFNISSYAPGIYYLRFVSENYFNILKIVKE